MGNIVAIDSFHPVGVVVSVLGFSHLFSWHGLSSILLNFFLLSLPFLVDLFIIINLIYGKYCRH